MTVLPYYMARRLLGPAGGGVGEQVEYLGIHSGTSITGADIGAADAGRVVVLTVGFEGTAGNDRTLNSGTIGGIAIAVVNQASLVGRGSAIAYAVVPTEITADIAMTFSGALGFVRTGVCRLVPVTSTPLDSASLAETSTALILPIQVASGGSLIAVSVRGQNSGDTIVGYNGVDMIVENHDVAVSSSTVSSASIGTSENAAANEVSFTTGGSVVRSGAAASWL